jgi:hypothetical protein
LCTIDDFRALTRDLGVRVERSVFLSGGRRIVVQPNLRAEQALFVLMRA